MSTTPFASPPLDTPWIPTWPLAPARLGELAYAEYVAAVAVTATAEASANVVVTAPAISVDGATAIVVEFFTPTAYPSQSIASAGLRFFLFQDGVSIGQIGQLITPAAGNMQAPIRLLRRMTPAAGVHTYSIRATQTGGEASSYAGPGGVGQFMPGFIRISLAAPLLSAPPGAAVAVQYGTSLPTNPLDGQEAILVNSVTDPAYQWRFRYNAGSTSAYKWEFVGGSMYTVHESTTVNFPTSWTPATPSWTAPKAGVYTITGYMLSLRSGAAAGGAALSMGFGYSDSGAAVVSTVAQNTVAANWMAATPFVWQAAMTAGQIVQFWLHGGGESQGRVMTVLPVRVS